MFGPDQEFSSSLPWPLIVRARFADEYDAIVAAALLDRVAAVAPEPVVRRVAAAVQDGLGRSEHVELEPAAKLGRIVGFLDFDPTDKLPSWIFTWPPKKSDPGLSELPSPMVRLAVASLEPALRACASPHLAELVVEQLATAAQPGSADPDPAARSRQPGGQVGLVRNRAH